MAEKTTLKKEQQQQKSKKNKQNEKKKNQENEVKSGKETAVPNHQNKNQNQNQNQKKKNKNNKNQFNNVHNNVNKTSKKKSGSNERSLPWIFFIRAINFLLIIGFIYVVDFDKFVTLRDGFSYCIKKIISFLPPIVVTKAKEALEYIQPAAEVTVNKLNAFLNETSTFFNTNPLVKDHWTNIKEISSICSAHLVDYMRTLYLQTTTYCQDVKNKLFH